MEKSSYFFLSFPSIGKKHEGFNCCSVELFCVWSLYTPPTASGWVGAVGAIKCVQSRVEWRHQLNSNTCSSQPAILSLFRLLTNIQRKCILVKELTGIVVQTDSCHLFQGVGVTLHWYLTESDFDCSKNSVTHIGQSAERHFSNGNISFSALGSFQAKTSWRIWILHGLVQLCWHQ